MPRRPDPTKAEADRPRFAEVSSPARTAHLSDKTTEPLMVLLEVVRAECLLKGHGASRFGAGIGTVPLHHEYRQAGAIASGEVPSGLFFRDRLSFLVGFAAGLFGPAYFVGSCSGSGGFDFTGIRR